MGVSDEFRAHVRDLFAGIGPVDVRRMFGGAGIYLHDACFAIVVDGAIFMRGDDALGPDLEAAGGERWAYVNPTGRETMMPYWRLPESALDDPDEAAAWAGRALVPAEKAAAGKRAAKTRRQARAAER